MSKTDAMRAMKQARLEAQRAAAPGPASVTRPAAARSAARAAAAAVTPSSDLVPVTLCGHTAISGRRCTRPQGHAEKNHRYAA